MAAFYLLIFLSIRLYECIQFVFLGDLLIQIQVNMDSSAK